MGLKPDTASAGRGRSVLVTGASGVVGAPMCNKLKQGGFSVFTLGRTVSESVAGVICDLSKSEEVSVSGKFDILVHTAPLWLLPDNLEKIARTGVQRIVAFSSTSVETKAASEQESDQSLVEALRRAEQNSRRIALAHSIGLTLFRPTMIYGFCRDKNVTAIANLINRFGIFPVAGSAKGLRQPVHALDLVESCLYCIDNEMSVGKTYNLGGDETLSYKQMVDRIFLGLGRKPRTIHVAVTVYKALLAAMLKLRVLNGISPEVAGRMNEDFCFDNGPARADFAYSGSKFLDNPARDLPHGGISY